MSSDPIAPNTKSVISPNLLPTEEKESICYNIFAETVKKVIKIGLILLIIFWATGGLLLLKINQEKKTFSQKIQSEITSDKLKELESLNAKLREAGLLNSKIKKFASEEYNWSGFFSELEKITPQGVAILNFEPSVNQPGWVTLKGIAEERDKFLALKDGLEQSDLCDKVDSPLSNYISAEGLEFELNVQLRGWNPSWGKDIKKKAKANASVEGSE